MSNKKASDMLIADIISWHKETFKRTDLKAQKKKWLEEVKEFNKAVDACSPKGILEEAADLFIVACGIARFSLTDGIKMITNVSFNALNNGITAAKLSNAIRRKMAVNVTRTWSAKNGVYKHKN